MNPPTSHTVNSDKLLYRYAMNIKQKYLKKSVPLKKVSYCSKMESLRKTLGVQISSSKTHGSKLKTNHEIQIIY